MESLSSLIKKELNQGRRPFERGFRQPASQAVLGGALACLLITGVLLGIDRFQKIASQASPAEGLLKTAKASLLNGTVAGAAHSLLMFPGLLFFNERGLTPAEIEI
jgi:hypothetical protein